MINILYYLRQDSRAYMIILFKGVQCLKELRAPGVRDLELTLNNKTALTKFTLKVHKSIVGPRNLDRRHFERNIMLFQCVFCYK